MPFGFALQAIPLRYGVMLGGFAEWLGATILGYGVSKTIQKGVAEAEDPACWACSFCDSNMSVYALGMLAALMGACCFLVSATYFRYKQYILKVSTTGDAAATEVSRTRGKVSTTFCTTESTPLAHGPSVRGPRGGAHASPTCSMLELFVL